MNLKIIETLFTEKTQNTFFQLFRYFIVGGIAFVVDFSLLYILTDLLNFHYLLSAGISFIFGLLVNYTISISWVFNKDKFNPKSILGKDFLIFLVTGVIGLGLNECLMYLFTEKLSFFYLLSKVIVAVLVLLWNFFSRKIILNIKTSER